MGRNVRVFHNLVGGPNATVIPNPYSLIVEQRGKGDILLVENYAIVSLGAWNQLSFHCRLVTATFSRDTSFQANRSTTP